MSTQNNQNEKPIPALGRQDGQYWLRFRKDTTTAFNYSCAKAKDPVSPPLELSWSSLKEGLRLFASELTNRVTEAVRGEVESLQAKASPAPAQEDGLLTYADVAKILQVSERQVQTLAYSGELKRIPIGRSVRFHPEDVKAFIRRKAEKG